MATVNFSVPDDVKAALNSAFAGQNKSAVITGLMREAVERSLRQQRSRLAIDRILGRHADAPLQESATLDASRRKGRP